MNQSGFCLEIAEASGHFQKYVLQRYKDMFIFWYHIDTVEAYLFLKCILFLKNQPNGFEFQFQIAGMNWQK